MSSNETPPPPPAGLNVRALARANLIGIGLFAVLIVSAALVDGLLWLLGMDSAVGRVLIAVFVGPLIIGVITMIFWKRILARLQRSLNTSGEAEAKSNE